MNPVVFVYVIAATLATTGLITHVAPLLIVIVACWTAPPILLGLFGCACCRHGGQPHDDPDPVERQVLGQ